MKSAAWMERVDPLSAEVEQLADEVRQRDALWAEQDALIDAALESGQPNGFLQGQATRALRQNVDNDGNLVVVPDPPDTRTPDPEDEEYESLLWAYGLI